MAVSESMVTQKPTTSESFSGVGIFLFVSYGAGILLNIATLVLVRTSRNTYGSYKRTLMVVAGCNLATLLFLIIFAVIDFYMPVEETTPRKFLLMNIVGVLIGAFDMNFYCGLHQYYHLRRVDHYFDKKTTRVCFVLLVIVESALLLTALLSGKKTALICSIFLVTTTAIKMILLSVFAYFTNKEVDIATNAEDMRDELQRMWSINLAQSFNFGFLCFGALLTLVYIGAHAELFVDAHYASTALYMIILYSVLNPLFPLVLTPQYREIVCCCLTEN